MSHTQGPWEVCGRAPGIVIATAHPNAINMVVARLTGTRDDAGNASLIAAAPDLLAAVKSVLTALDGGDESAMDEAEELCRAALLKSETVTSTTP